MINEFKRYFAKEECEEVYGEKDGKFFVSWTSVAYTDDGKGEIDEEKWNEVLEFVLDKLLSGISFNDLIIDSDENMEYIARNKLEGFSVMTNIDLNDDKCSEVLLALTFDTDSGCEDRCHTAIGNEYADIIVAEAKKLVEAKKSEDQTDDNAELELLQDRCYEAYKVQWMLLHGWSVNALINGISKCAMEYSPEVTPVEEIIREATRDFVRNQGFDSNMWACKEEFLDSEFLDSDYMDFLFCCTFDGETLRKQYHRLVK